MGNALYRKIETGWGRVRNLRRKGAAAEPILELPSGYPVEDYLLVAKVYISYTTYYYYFTSSAPLMLSYGYSNPYYLYTVSITSPCYSAVYRCVANTGVFSVVQARSYYSTGSVSNRSYIVPNQWRGLIYNNFDVYDWDGDLVKAATARERCLRFKPDGETDFTGRVNI